MTSTQTQAAHMPDEPTAVDPEGSRVIISEFFRAGDKDYGPKHFIQAVREQAREARANTVAANVAAGVDPATAIIPLAALAWSQDDEPSAVTQKAAPKAKPALRQPWSKAWLMAAVILIGAAVVALAIVAAIPAAADPGGDPGNVIAMQPPKPSAATQDDQFLAAIARWHLRVADVRAAIAGAHEACSLLAAGHNAEDVVKQAMRDNHTLTRNDAISFYNAALTYCPKYLKLTGTVA